MSGRCVGHEDYYGLVSWVCDCGCRHRFEVSVCHCGHVRTPDDRERVPTDVISLRVVPEVSA